MLAASPVVSTLPGAARTRSAGCWRRSTTSVRNYGVSIILLTLLIELVLLPLGVKQIKSMQAMQSIQPKVKELQKKYKGNKPKAQEETMKLYKEAGVNPLGGCLPLLLQFPILIAMYAVIRAPAAPRARRTGEPVAEGKRRPTWCTNNHLPVDSQLFEDVDRASRTLACHREPPVLGARRPGPRRRSKDTAGQRRCRPGMAPRQRRGRWPIPGVTTNLGRSRAGLRRWSSTDKIPYFALLS